MSHPLRRCRPCRSTSKARITMMRRRPGKSRARRTSRCGSELSVTSTDRVAKAPFSTSRRRSPTAPAPAMSRSTSLPPRRTVWAVSRIPRHPERLATSPPTQTAAARCAPTARSSPDMASMAMTPSGRNGRSATPPCPPRAPPSSLVQGLASWLASGEIKSGPDTPSIR